MWSTIVAVVSAVLASLLSKYLDVQRAKDALLSDLNQKQSNEIINQMGKAYEKPEDYYNGNPSELISWLQQRESEDLPPKS